ncbi:hypothetical protein Ddc_09192 [Ditylenchus destructor]|nr:hypothetical protein Ddc_09192 [Ditylenchus destructor]
MAYKKTLEQLEQEVNVLLKKNPDQAELEYLRMKVNSLSCKLDTALSTKSYGLSGPTKSGSSRDAHVADAAQVSVSKSAKENYEDSSIVGPDTDIHYAGSAVNPNSHERSNVASAELAPSAPFLSPLYVNVEEVPVAVSKYEDSFCAGFDTDIHYAGSDVNPNSHERSNVASAELAPSAPFLSPLYVNVEEETVEAKKE